MQVDKTTGELIPQAKVLRFATRTSPHKIPPQTNFSPTVPKYELTLDKKGQKTLQQCGETNIYEKIQQYKDDCDIFKIIQRAALGDTTLLEKRIGQFMDITGMPANLHESHKYLEKAVEDFNKLPEELKAEFNNNVYEFAAATDDRINRIIRKIKKMPEPAEKPKQAEGQIEMNLPEGGNNEQK